MGEKSTTIKFDVSLDENQIPDKITWEASDNSETGDCDAAFLTIWDQKEKNTLRIDLWTKDMMIDDMQIFFHQMMLSMSDTYKRATGDEKLSKEMKEFAFHMGQSMGILKKGEE
ncbi:gliding motility protein GldC [bacterium]|nr:gliding motility protein GldC [bacterium]MDC1222121.1 gliding motility protein GldC [Salibacteraceae bacterium]